MSIGANEFLAVKLSHQQNNFGHDRLIPYKRGKDLVTTKKQFPMHENVNLP